MSVDPRQAVQCLLNSQDLTQVLRKDYKIITKGKAIGLGLGVTIFGPHVAYWWSDKASTSTV
jgi:hypothetical protein